MPGPLHRLTRPLRRSLRTRLVLSFLLLALATVAVVGAVVYTRATEDLTAAVYDRLDAVVGLKADALDRWLDEQSRNVVFVGVMPGVGDDTRDFLDPTMPAVERAAAEHRLRQVLATVVSQTADAEEIYILDLEGTVRISTAVQHEGMGLADQDFFGTGQSHTTIQNAYRSPLTRLPTITVATPLFDKDGNGQRVAVVAANLSLQRVDRIVLDKTGLGQTGRAFLVGTDGRPIQALTSGVEPAVVSSYAVDQVTAGNSGQALYAAAEGMPVIGVYRWLENRNAGLVAEMHQDEAFGSARRLLATIGLVGLVSAVLLAVGIWFVARRITRPILSLAGTAQRVQAGDLEATSGITAEDEVGTLAVAFDAMTAELRTNVETLERRVAERTDEIRRQQQYFEALVEVSPVAIVTMDNDQQVSAWNPAATRLFGFTPGEALGQPIELLLLRSDELREHGSDIATEALETGRAHRAGRRMRKDGTLVDVDILMVPLVIDGARVGFYVIYHDISELEAARRDADAANQAKSAFLAAMSHEIRTPMNAVIGMSGLLLDTSLDAEQRDYSETIHTSGEALLTIINDILDFSKIEAGRFELDSHPFRLAGTIEGALDVMGPIAAKKGLELAYELEPELPPVVMGDAGRLRQIVLNLLSNALKFTDTGEVVLRVGGSPVPGDAAGRWELQVEIHDTGIGIPPDRVGRLFQSFSQTDSSIARKYGGTGLGLAISRRLAELMDGSLIAESAGIPGEGSTFRLRVRVGVAPAGSVAPEGVAPAGTAGASTAGASTAAGAPSAAEASALTGRRVLVVDDNATNLRILTQQLQGLGLAVTATGSSVEARDLATSPGAFDIVLTDLRMPAPDGLELAAAIHATGAGAPPVVVLSSLGGRERNQVGVVAVLTKPVKPAALRHALIAALGGTVTREAQAIPHVFVADVGQAVRHPHTILLAEDNAFNQKLAFKLLERMGYAADLAQDGAQAVAAVARGTYDVVLMDVQMPEVDGLEATRRIRAQWPERQLHIVAMTANAMEGDRETCLAAGMDDYVAKPIRPDELSAVLARAPSPGLPG